MTYSTRNSFYLRISKTVVLPLYIYLDERHISWMADKILQHVLSDLRPNILDKLKTESEIVLGAASTQKKATVDTHRGDTYQFCYFLRKTEPHSVLIKSRKFTVAPPPASGAKFKPSQRKNNPGKRKNAAHASPTRSKKRKTKGRLPPEMATSDDDTDDGEYLPSNNMPTNELEDSTTMDLEIEEAEEKPKPILGLTHQGFNLYGHCLCVVVEPWPVVRAVTIPPFLSKSPAQGANLRETPPLGNAQEAEPLFLPEEPDDKQNKLVSADNSVSQVNKAYLNQVLTESELSEEDDDDMGGMMEFSQVLYNIGDLRAGAINDDDDADGSILFGDADEFKEL